MSKLAFLASAALLLAVWPLTARLGPQAGSLVLVALAALLAIAASGEASALAVTGGALGAFAGGLLVAGSPALAGAALVGLGFAERSARVRGGRARLAHVAIAITAGAIAGRIGFEFAAAALGLRAVAVAVGAVLLALPLLVDADDPLAHALDGAADAVTGPAQGSLRAGAELRRSLDEELLDRAAARQVHQTWRALLRLADARVRLERRGAGPGKAEGSPADAVRARVDARLADHVAALTRAYAAVDAARAAEVSLDDTALRGTESAGESLEQVSRAFVEDV